MTIIEIVGLIFALAVVLVGFVVARRRLLLSGGGGVDMSLRSGSDGDWAFGVGRYAGDELRWYRVFTLSLRPVWVMARTALQVQGQRIPVGEESFSVHAGTAVVSCDLMQPAPSASRRVTLSGEVELAMSSAAVAGFLSWLESSPPGYALPPGHYAS